MLGVLSIQLTTDFIVVVLRRELLDRLTESLHDFLEVDVGVFFFGGIVEPDELHKIL